MSNAIGNKDIETFAGTDGCSFLVKRSVQRREVWCLHQCYGSKWSCTAHSCPGASITRSSQRAENILSLQSAPANKASCVPVWVTTPQLGSSLLRHWIPACGAECCWRWLFHLLPEGGAEQNRGETERDMPRDINNLKTLLSSPHGSACSSLNS